MTSRLVHDLKLSTVLAAFVTFQFFKLAIRDIPNSLRLSH